MIICNLVLKIKPVIWMTFLYCCSAFPQKVLGASQDLSHEMTRTQPFFKRVSEFISSLPFFSVQDDRFIPITYDKNYLPFIDLEIEKNAYSLMLDLGLQSQMAVDREILKKINKKPYGTEKAIDFTGKCYNSQKYLIPEIKIGNTVFFDVILKETSERFENEYMRYHANDVPKKIGMVGRALLKRKNIFLDFPHLRMAFIENRNEKDLPFSVDSMLAVPYERISTEIVLNIETEFGEKKFLLDTGCTVRTIKTTHSQQREIQKDDLGQEYITTSKFVIAGKDFGQGRLYLWNPGSKFKEIDGILGMSFLRHYALYIDFHKKTLYIGDYATLEKTHPLESNDADECDSKSEKSHSS